MVASDTHICTLFYCCISNLLYVIVWEEILVLSFYRVEFCLWCWSQKGSLALMRQRIYKPDYFHGLRWLQKCFLFIYIIIYLQREKERESEWMVFIVMRIVNEQVMSLLQQEDYFSCQEVHSAMNRRIQIKVKLKINQAN